MIRSGSLPHSESERPNSRDAAGLGLDVQASQEKEAKDLLVQQENPLTQVTRVGWASAYAPSPVASSSGVATEGPRSRSSTAAANAAHAARLSLEALESYGDAPTQLRSSALLMAASSGSTGLLTEVLGKYGELINCDAGSGQLPLGHWCVKSKNSVVPMLSCLSLHGYDLSRRDQTDGWTLLHVAAASGGDEAVPTMDWLLSKGLEVDALSKKGWTAGHAAIQWDAYPGDTLDFLSTKGLDFSVPVGGSSLAEFSASVAENPEEVFGWLGRKGMMPRHNKRSEMQLAVLAAFRERSAERALRWLNSHQTPLRDLRLEGHSLGQLVLRLSDRPMDALRALDRVGGLSIPSREELCEGNTDCR